MSTEEQTTAATDQTRLKAVIADDEPLARLHLKRLLELQGVDIIGEAEDASSTLQCVETLHPTLLFLDIQMPLLSGMQTAAALLQIDRAPLIIFVTGYSEYAVEAFERDALDYVLKPASAERLARTLIRARQRLAADRSRQKEVVAAVDRQVVTLPPLRRIPIRTNYAVRLLRIEDVRYVEAQRKSVVVYTTTEGPEQSQRTYFTLTQLESLLPPEIFCRIHDSYLVNLEHVEELSFLGNHSYAVRLTDGETLPVGRTRYAHLKDRLGIDRFG